MAQKNLKTFRPGVYAHWSGNRFRLLGFSFLNGYPAADIMITSKEWKADCGGGEIGIAIENWLEFSEGFERVKSRK